jgi:hypothetical protein
MKHIHLILLLLALPFYFMGCKDDPPEGMKPAPATNYWSKAFCKVDGKEWGDSLTVVI